MLILAMRTDKPEAELGLYDGEHELAYKKWEAHRKLAETLHSEIYEILQKHGKKLGDVQAIAVFKGPGSFTGLRIGISVANALADSLEVPVIGADGSDWVHQAASLIQNGNNDEVVMPEYGAAPRITKPKH